MIVDRERVNSLGWKFPVRCAGVTFQNCERIHPLKQVDVQLVVNMLKKYNYVRKVIVFGSAVSMRCHSGSDLDLYVETGDTFALPLIDESLLYTEIDVLNDPICFDKGVGLAIAMEGITVYERAC